MNLIKLIKNKLQLKSFDEKVSDFLDKAFLKENNDNLIHNNGNLVREDSKLCVFEHNFATGIYLRRMILAQGAYVVGCIHKRDHVWFLLDGYVTVATQNGKQDYVAPYVGFAKAGTRRIVYAHEKTIFQNVFQNPFEYRNLDKLEEYNFSLTKKDYDDFIRSRDIKSS
tara:strand:- start:46 stop:549 length:504 start_codon:yes stop_codon:yes gene_type:complete